MKPYIKEIIVVEGRDDVTAVSRAVRATCMTTSGMGLAPEKLADIRALAEKRGCIILTDPDAAGTKIRNAVAAAVPGARHAYMTREEASDPRTGKPGVESASPEAIRAALERAYATVQPDTPPRYSMTDLMRWRLTGCPDAAARRDRFCRALGLGHANAAALLGRLNASDIEPEAIQAALETMDE
jgi:ribonuclease M5